MPASSHDNELMSRDIAARTDALDVERSFIVQAPAGSGKTELLIQRYLGLLAIVDQPEEVLAITFTRKASQEMRIRVLEALRNARDGVAAESNHERQTISLADAVLSRAGDNDWQLIESPGRMRIETVDAFGSGIARSLPLSSGLGGSGKTIADAEMSALYRDAASATLDYLAADDEIAQAVERVLNHLDGNTGLYISYLSRMLASREQWLGITGSGISSEDDAEQARARLEANIATVVRTHLVTLVSMLPAQVDHDLPPLLQYAGQNLNADGKTTHFLAPFADDARMPVADPADRSRWHGLANLLLTQKGGWRKQATKNDGFPAGNKEPKEALADVINALREVPNFREYLDRCRLLPEPRYEDGQWHVLRALFALLPVAVAELRRLFSESGVTDHNEVALAAGRALGSSDNPGDIALMLDYQVRHLLIDEMQDTSIAQYGLLRTLTSGWVPEDGRTVFCVGDPMQSIYRFRDAEVGEFLVAREQGIGNVTLTPLTLRQNFRSGENLVHWFNTVFMQVMPGQDDLSVGAISYAESVPIPEKAGQGSCAVHPLFDLDSAGEATETLQVIKRCLDESRDENAAVLVRSRTQLNELLPELRHAGIEYQAVEIERLTDLPEIIDLIALTRALCHDGDRLAWLALLRGPAAGLCWKDIHSLVYNDSKRTILELCDDAERLASLSDDGRNRLTRLLNAILPYRRSDTTTSLRERIELAWYAIGGPALLADDDQLENVYRYLATIDRISFAGTLHDIRELEQRLDEERVSSTVSADCRLQVMTMHKSKGLQFDHVFLPGLGRGTRGGSKEVLSWLNLPDQDGQNEMIISPVGPRATLENDPLHRFIEETEKDKSRLELDRLLYVACTRAKASLHLIGAVKVANDGESLRTPDSRSLLRRLWPVVEAEYERVHAETPVLKTVDEASGTEQFVVPDLRRMVAPWSCPDVPLPPGKVDTVPSETDEKDRKIEYYWVGAAARHAGTIVHRWLQRISDERLLLQTDRLESLRPITRRWADSLGVPSADLDFVCQRVQDALLGVLEDEKGRWIVHGEGAAELPLTGAFDGRIESIVIDRVRIDEDGTHWIIDYKTSTHEGGDEAGFLQQESDRYREQLAKYARIYSSLTGQKTRTALYFPLLQAFCEVETQISNGNA